MSNKFKYGLNLLANLTAICVTSFLLMYINVKQFSPLDDIDKLKRLESISFDIMYSVEWKFQFITIAMMLMLLFKYLKLIKFEPKCITYAFLVSIIYEIADFVSHTYIITKLNNITYGINAGVMGSIGFIEDFVSQMLICLPLLMVMSIVLRIECKDVKSLAAINIVIFIAIFVLNKLTTDLWFPPLVNYGS